MKEQLLSSIPLFSTLPHSEIEHLAATLRTRHYPAGAVLVEEGATDAHFFILLSGKVEIIKSLGTLDERLLAVREHGTTLGEMSLFTPTRAHTASVRSLTPLTLLEMTRSEFDALLHRQPALAYQMTSVMSHRLEESENLTILDLRQKNQQLTQAYEELKAAQEQIVEKERLEKELQIARHIQESILPQKIPQYAGMQCGALMIPARAVGGDMYDFIPLSEDMLGIVVGDVSDKGVPSALFMTLTYSLVRAEASLLASPGETLRRVNHHLLDINASNMFVTLIYGVMDTRTGKFTYARAGQPPLILASVDGQQIHVPFRLGQALGLFEDLSLDEGQIELPNGGCMLLFSDGLTEAMNQLGEYYSLDRLFELLVENKQKSPQDFCQILWDAVKEFTESLSQTDDFTVAMIRKTL